MSFYKVILYLGSTIGFHAWMFKKHIMFSIFEIVAASPSSQSVTLCLVPVSMKLLLLKTTLCSDWLAGPVCCDRSTALSVFQKCHWEYQHTNNATQPGPVPFYVYALGGNYLNEEYCEMFVPRRKPKTNRPIFSHITDQTDIKILLILQRSCFEMTYCNVCYSVLRCCTFIYCAVTITNCLSRTIR